MVVKVVTYATHSFGTFEEIINNKFDIDVVVLGWGQKWNGFMDKFKGVYKYIKTLDNEDIVIFIDGFDSQILRPLDETIHKFNQLNCRMLVSQIPRHQQHGIAKYFTSKMSIFEKLKNKTTHIVNSGLYMGYVKELKLVFEKILDNHNTCRDDQRVLNEVRENFEFIEIDKDEVIFSNDDNPDSCFVQHPGKFSFSRATRAVKEYSQFFLIEFFLLFLLLFIIFKKIRVWICAIYIIIMILFLLFADRSCL